MRATLAILAGMIAVLSAQQPQQTARLEFEVASVRRSIPPDKPSPGGNQSKGGGSSSTPCRVQFTFAENRLDLRCFTVNALISHAFVTDRIVGPDWITSDPKFDIAAKLPEGTTETQIPLMLQTLLADRFHLAIHREKREMQAYGIVVAKSGLKAKRVSSAIPDSDRRGTVRRTMESGGIEHVEASNITFEGLAEVLSSSVIAPVPIVDMTGLKGRYQLELDLAWREVAAAGIKGPLNDPATDPDVLAAEVDQFQRSLQKYGLRLESRKAPVEIIVIDRVEKTPTEN